MHNEGFFKRFHEGDIGVCGIAVLANFSCGISVIVILNCGIAVFSAPAGRIFLAFWSTIVGQRRILHIFRPFLAVSGRFGSNLKQPYFIAHFKEQFDCFNDQFKALSLFPRSHRSLLPLILPSRQRIRQVYRITMRLRYFPIFFCGNAVFNNPQCPPLSS